MTTDQLNASDLKFLFGAPPEEAIAYLEKKGMRISWNWHDTLDSANARSFTAAKVARVEILQTLKKELVNTLKNGGTEKQFIDNLTPTLQKQGWWGKQIIVDSKGNAEVAQMGSPRRLKTIFRTNMQSAYMAGRFKTMMENIDTHPYWKYIAILDNRTRPAHRALDGRVFSVEDGFTDVGYPPNGYNCRCRAVAVSASRVKREGIKPTVTDGVLQTRTVEAGIDKRTGEVKKTQIQGFYLMGANGKKVWVGPDAGFNNSPASSHIMDDVLLKNASALNNSNALKQVQQVIKSAPRMQAWRGFVNNSLEYGYTQNQNLTVAVMQSQPLELAIKYITSDISPVVSLEDRLIVGKKADRHIKENKQLSPEDLISLPILLVNPLDFAYDTQENSIVYKLMGINGRQILFAINVENGKTVAATVYYDDKNLFDEYLKEKTDGSLPRYIKE